MAEDKEGLLLTEIKEVLQKVANVGGTDAISKYENLQTYLGIKSQDVLSKVLKAGYKSLEEVEAKIEEAKKQERERIIREVEKYISTGCWVKDNIFQEYEWWQALKSPDKGE